MPLNQITPLVGIPLSQIWGPLVLVEISQPPPTGSIPDAETDRLSECPSDCASYIEPCECKIFLMTIRKKSYLCYSLR